MRLVSFLLVGKLTIYLLQKFPFRKTIIGSLFEEGKLLAELFVCDLCLGVWVYLVLGYFLKIDLMKYLFGVYIIGLNEFLTGAIVSFLVHVFSIGWNTKFGIIVLE
jgi:hypothetical protein